MKIDAVDGEKQRVREAKNFSAMHSMKDIQL